MVKCFVVFCKSGYSSCKEKVSMSKVPQGNLFYDWRKAIPKREIELRLNSHMFKTFLKYEVLCLDIWSWRITNLCAILSIFPGYPLSCIPKTTIKRKSPKKRVVQSNMDSCVATTPIVKISECDQGKLFETSQKVTSSFQLKTIVYSLYSLVICRGVSPEISYYVVHIMKKGYINILNYWQSVECKFQIEEPNKSICSKCILLSRAQLSKDKGKNKSLSTLLSSGNRKKVIRTRKAIRKSRIRLLHKNYQLEEMVKSYKHKIDSISKETIQQHIKRLNLNSAQGMVINECLRIGKFNSKTSRRYSNDWLLTCLLMQILYPAIYKFMLKNEILPLPCVQTIKRHLSLVKLDFGFDPAFFEMFKTKINLKTEQQKYGVLIFDEMSVRKSLKTDPITLRYQGVVNFGNDDIGSTKNEALADHANAMPFQAILLLEHAGAKVTGIIRDGAKPNRRMWKEFGITGELGATSFGLVRWKHYQILYNEEKNLPGNTRVCPKLTESHVNPCSFAKMRVSFMKKNCIKCSRQIA
ncbi:Uncharacterized protein FWK35_00013066 [Aphis craccivora]|uniref:Transposable element P transposase-like RNase H domain-containing protein n=1 Tax=Aphis craccivora TaxID=307492 RepID=A0A6G0Y8M0_APHCR|nr:Uncharacterized protein FWK35_00013066 [Aphis craccivora]